uniref:Uncharacterized protein n=1 Tax=Odontella aurita TaxID=265563 RepID=A0A7S4MTW8_9STRA
MMNADAPAGPSASPHPSILLGSFGQRSVYESDDDHEVRSYRSIESGAGDGDMMESFESLPPLSQSVHGGGDCRPNPNSPSVGSTPSGAIFSLNDCSALNGSGGGGGIEKGAPADTPVLETHPATAAADATLPLATPDLHALSGWIERADSAMATSSGPGSAKDAPEPAASTVALPQHVNGTLGAAADADAATSEIIVRSIASYLSLSDAESLCGSLYSSDDFSREWNLQEETTTSSSSAGGCPRRRHHLHNASRSFSRGVNSCRSIKEDEVVVDEKKNGIGDNRLCGSSAEGMVVAAADAAAGGSALSLEKRCSSVSWAGGGPTPIRQRLG